MDTQCPICHTLTRPGQSYCSVDHEKEAAARYEQVAALCRHPRIQLRETLPGGYEQIHECQTCGAEIRAPV